MYKMTDEEFYEIYGRMPRRTRKKKIKIYWHRIIIALIILILLIIGIVKLIQLIIGKVKGGDEDNSSVSASSVADGENEAADIQESDSDYSNVRLTICIDPAHGGMDNGMENADGRYEKDDTMNIAVSLKKYLDSCGVNVILTRNGDVFSEVSERCRTANTQGADFVISIHRGSVDAGSGDTYGFEAWINSSEPKTDRAFAAKILSKLEEVGVSEDRGIKVGFPNDTGLNYSVNEQTQMPSVLLNMGYITSDEDNQLFDENLDEYARAIGNAIIETAIDLGVVDENGKRQKNEQLLSEKEAIIVQEPEPIEPPQDDDYSDDLDYEYTDYYTDYME